MKAKLKTKQKRKTKVKIPMETPTTPFVYRGKVGVWCIPCAKKEDITYKDKYTSKPGDKIITNNLKCSKCKKKLTKKI